MIVSGPSGQVTVIRGAADDGLQRHARWLKKPGHGSTWRGAHPAFCKAVQGSPNLSARPRSGVTWMDVHSALERVSATYQQLTALATVGFLDLRVGGVCPALEPLEQHLPECDEGLFGLVVRGIEALGFRFRVRSARSLKAMYRVTVPSGEKAPAGLFRPAEREIAICANLPQWRRMLACLHEYAHLADLLSTMMGLGHPKSVGSTVREWFWRCELTADLVAAVVAKLHGVRAYRCLCAALHSLWELYDEVRPAAEVGGRASKATTEFAHAQLHVMEPRVRAAATLAELVLEAVRTGDPGSVHEPDPDFFRHRTVRGSNRGSV